MRPSFRICLLLCILLLLQGYPSSALEPTVILVGYQVNPAVLMPGERGLITISLTSTSQNAMRTDSTTFGIYPSSSISETRHLNPVVESVFLSGGDLRVIAGNSQFEGEIGPNQVVNLTFLVEAPQKAGIYFPVLRIRVRGAESLIYPIPVNVNTPVGIVRTPVLILEKPEAPSIRPGEAYRMTVRVRNAGEGMAEEVTIRIVDDDPSIAVSGNSSYRIERLGAGESKAVDVALITGRTTMEGIHELPVSVEYAQVDGSRVVQTESIALNIRGESRLVIRSVETDPVRVSEGDRFDLIIRLENTGTAKARSIRTSVDLPLQGIREAYIGTIREGNDAPAVFVLLANRSGEMGYTFSVSYEDDWGVRREEYSLQLVVSPSERPFTIGLALMILCIAGIAGWYLWKKKGTR